MQNALLSVIILQISEHRDNNAGVSLWLSLWSRIAAYTCDDCSSAKPLLRLLLILESGAHALGLADPGWSCCWILAHSLCWAV